MLSSSLETESFSRDIRGINIEMQGRGTVHVHVFLEEDKNL